MLGNQIYHSLNVRAQNAVGENWQFIKLVSTGKINLYNLYSSLDVASVTNDGLSEKFIWYAEHPSWIFYKENPKRNARYVSDIAAKRDLSDCQVVYDKFKNKEYENEKTSVKVMGIKQTDKLTIGLTVIKEYNSICK